MHLRCRPFAFAALVFLAVFATGCASPPAKPAASLLRTDPLSLPAAQNTSRVVIINRYPEWMEDGTIPLNLHAAHVELHRGIRFNSLNVQVNGKDIANIAPFEFAQLDLPMGSHRFRLVHPDLVVDWTGEFDVLLDQPLVHLVVGTGIGRPHLTKRQQPVRALEKWHRNVASESAKAK